MTEEQLSALLRLKRYEQPPPGYFDNLLTQVHRRQRADLLRRPLWKIFAERVQVFFSEHSMGNLSYAGAMAGVLAVGVGVISLLTPGTKQNSNTLAENQPIPIAAGPQLASVPPLPPVPQDPSLQERKVPATLVSQPRYVIDARPVSYEPAPAFSF